jgi:16S rRNA (adenine1518-N6/adenine1519-N6)-dimethyltransferase
VIARHGIRATKSLGQHFLLDRNLIQKIVREAGALENSTVLEIGAGPGGLTRELLATSARTVIAVERDRRCIAALNELAQVSSGRLVVVEADALKIDEAKLISGSAKVVANLPYNIATELFFKWQERPRLLRGLTLMFQKEVAERFTASPRSKAYGRLSVMAQWRYEVRRAFDLPPEAFVPPPKVTSTVIQFTLRAEPLAAADPIALRQVVAAAFGQRRKMLRGSLRSLPCDTGALLDDAGIIGEARAEELEISDFCALARSFANLVGKPTKPLH